MIVSFQDLEVYKKSKNLFPKIVTVVKKFPKDGSYLRNQILRSGNSIHSNIAEGFGRSEAEFKQYLTRSLGSNNETISHLEDAYSSKYISHDLSEELIKDYTVLGKQIYTLREKWHKFKNV